MLLANRLERYWQRFTTVEEDYGLAYQRHNVFIVRRSKRLQNFHVYHHISTYAFLFNITCMDCGLTVSRLRLELDVSDGAFSCRLLANGLGRYCADTSQCSRQQSKSMGWLISPLLFSLFRRSWRLQVRGFCHHISTYAHLFNITCQGCVLTVSLLRLELDVSEAWSCELLV